MICLWLCVCYVRTDANCEIRVRCRLPRILWKFGHIFCRPTYLNRHVNVYKLIGRMQAYRPYIFLFCLFLSASDSFYKQTKTFTDFCLICFTCVFSVRAALSLFRFKCKQIPLIDIFLIKRYQKETATAASLFEFIQYCRYTVFRNCEYIYDVLAGSCSSF